MLNIVVSPYKQTTINWIFNFEDRLDFPVYYSFSRLLPTHQQYDEFKAYLGEFRLVRVSFLDKLQMFVYWLVDQDKGIEKHPQAYLNMVLPYDQVEAF